MRTAMRWIGLAIVITGVVSGVAAPARADLSLTFSVDGSTASEINDSFTNQANTTTINVPDGGSIDSTLQGGTYSVVASNVVAQQPLPVFEKFTANTVISTLTLVGTIVVTPAVHTLLFASGAPTVLTLPGGQTLTVTFDGLPEVDRTSAGSTAYTLTATFALSPANTTATTTPEPSTLASAVTGVLMVLGYAWRKRRRAMSAAT